MKPSLDRARVYRIFLEALDLEEDLRDAFVDGQCGDDPVVRDEVHALLAVALRGNAPTGIVLPPQLPAQENLSGEIYGRFRLAAAIGEGGMGVVYRAERTDGVQQTVAIKLVSATGSKTSQARFEREAQHLARLEHPAVARLIDAGLERGRAWIAMEFVPGERIDAYCARHRLGAVAIVGLLVQIADAIAAAHRMLVVHSDIKPANVLLTADGSPKLIDFGISTALRDAGAVTAETVGVGRLFSPGYAAPEQVQGSAVTVATDVFGLGALAYRLLTAKSIFPDVSDPISYMLAIGRRDVDLPSRVVAQDGVLPVSARDLRGDLDAILCKALERDPARRYLSVGHLQADLRRYLGRRPVLARRQSLGYRLDKYVRRNAIGVAIAAAFALTLATAGIFLQVQGHRAALARDMAARRGEFLENLLKSADPREGRRDVSVAQLLDAASAELDAKLGSEPLVEASMLGLIAQTDGGLGRYDEALSASARQLRILKASGGSALDIGRALSLRGDLLRDQGKWAEAEPFLRGAVADLRPLDATVDYCEALTRLGVVLMHHNQEKEAEGYFREALALESQGGPELQRRRLDPYRSLAILFAEQDRYDEALAAGHTAVDLARQTLPPEHPDRLSAQVQYAGILSVVGRQAEAEPVFRDVAAVQTRVLGAGHKDTLLTQFSLADNLLAQHRDDEAAALALTTAQGLEATVGADNLYAISAWLIRGNALCDAHPDEKAIAVLRQVVSSRKRIYPNGNWAVESAGVSLGNCLYRAHRYAEAEAILLPAVNALEVSRGPGFHRTQLAYTVLRDITLAQGRTPEAAAWSKKITSTTAKK